jgi:trehalose utilization protein
VSWYPGGEVFRSGLCYHRGRGKVFYFSPGHETYPIYYQKEVLHVISNAVKWAAPSGAAYRLDAPNAKPLEPLNNKREE